jgi:alkaline phosphatase D
MGNIILGPIIGAVDHLKAKIWCYGTCGQEGQEDIKWFCHVFDKDKTTKIPGSPFVFNVVLGPPHKYKKDGTLNKGFITEIVFPADGEEFSFGINNDAANIEAGELKYAVRRFPGEGDKDFSFALISCHKPRQKKLKHIPVMWKMLYDKMKEKNAGFLIQSGDQVYCDNGDKYTVNAWEKSLELANSKAQPGDEEHRKMLDYYRQVYFDGWTFDAVQHVMSSFPQYMIWDDHEVEDGWGSREEQFRPAEQAVFKAAKDAYYEFQHSHNPDSLKQGGMYYAFHYGAAAFLAPDLRGERNITTETLMSGTQFGEIKKWLESDRVKNSKVLFLVSSVPLFHLNRKLFSMSKVVTFFLKDVRDDVRDQWSSLEQNKEARRKLLRMLIDWSGPTNKPVFILGGDVHVGTEACIKKAGSETYLYQVTSSPITNNTAKLLDWFTAHIGNKFRFRLNDDRTEYISAKIIRRHRRRNFAILDVSYKDGEPQVKLNMYRQKKKEPKTRDYHCDCKKIKYKGEKR